MKTKAAAFAIVVIALAALLLTPSLEGFRDIGLGILLWDDTEYARQYSERRFREVQMGMTEEAVRSLLGSPLSERWHYNAQGSYGCVALSFDDGSVTSLLYTQDCESQGIRTTMSKPEVSRRLGPPDAVSWIYSRSPGDRHYRRRIVSFLQGRVSDVKREWYFD